LYENNYAWIRNRRSIIRDAIGLAALSTVVELIHRTSLKVLNAAENILVGYFDNIDIYDIPEFRDLKNLSDDTDLIIKEMKTEGKCPICYSHFGFDEETKEEVVKKWLVPCGHYMCEKCSKELQERNMLDKCPYCRRDVDRVSNKKLAEYYQLRPKSKRSTRKSSKSTRKSSKRQFLYNPNDPKKSFDVYIDKNPKDTIHIKYTTVQDVKDTIHKLERLYKEKRYPHKRIWQVGMIMKVRLEVIKDKKPEQYRLAKRYFNFLGDRTVTEKKERYHKKFIC